MKTLEYKKWRNFKKVINKTIISSNNSGNQNNDWIVGVNTSIITGKGKKEYI